MRALSELAKSKELPFNPGEIRMVETVPQWSTEAIGHQLILDIVPVPNPKSELGIASIVVMEQQSSFLIDAGKEMAEIITRHTQSSRAIVLSTTETKGSYFAPFVSLSLANKIGDRLLPQTVVFRKGEPKAYMQRKARVQGREIISPQVSYQSITSLSEQSMTISPRDTEFLVKAIRNEKAEPVFIDDFIGAGGTVVAVCRIFQQLGLTPPRIAAVIGSDGNLYQKTFTQEEIDITLLPQPFPLRLPTFRRNSPLEAWQINPWSKQQS